MKINTLAILAAGLSTTLFAIAQDPSPTPKFAGGQITGDAANGGPVGNNETGNIDYNSGGASGGSTAIAPPTPTPTPSATPRKPVKP
jgi:hypothetical protein